MLRTTVGMHTPHDGRHAGDVSLEKPGVARAQILNYAIFDTTASFAATNQQPQFGALRKIYPDSATAHPHLFRRLSVPTICVGEQTGVARSR